MSKRLGLTLQSVLRQKGTQKPPSGSKFIIHLVLRDP